MLGMLDNVGLGDFATEKLLGGFEEKASRMLGSVLSVLCSPILCTIKASVLWFLLRIGRHNTRIKWTIYTLNAINALFMMATITISLNHKILASYRFDIIQFYIASAAITIIVDVMVLAIPIRMFGGLNMR